MLSIIEEMEISKLNFEVNATATKIMALAGFLTATAPTLAKNPDPSSPKAKDTPTETIPDPENTEDEPVKWSEALTLPPKRKNG